MRKAKEMNDMKNLLEEAILNKDGKTVAKMTEMELITSNDDESRGARKALIWATKIVKKTKKEIPNKKLEEFGLKNPVK
tara:strand:+ start:3020 stop:3256 length:237 start_codon:yes stop_codon:yes gene_type:complete